MERRQYRQFLFVIAILSFFLVALLAFDTAASAVPAGDAPVRILVKAPPGQSAAELAEKLPERIAPRPRGFLAKLTVRKASAENVKVKRVLERTGWVAMEVPASVAEQLAGQGYRVEEDKQVHALLVDSVPLINATQVWALRDANGDNVTGKGITIAILDTGINYSHPDLGGCTNTTHLAGNCKVLPGYDYVNNDNDAADDHYHGTHVAGIAAANGTLKGVAPDATLVAYKVMNSSGSGWENDIIAAIENATAAGYDVISLSLGGLGDADDLMSQAVDTAVNAGVVVVIAAGNSGPGGNSVCRNVTGGATYSICSPGTARLAITVGNTNKNDGLESDSSRGPNPSTYEIKPELTAPGNNIVSTSIDGPNETLRGTSMSCPHVSGAAALLLQMHPTWTSVQVKAALVGTAKDLGLDVTDQGAGRIRVLAAVNASFVSLPSQLSLGVQSLPLANVTAYFNLSELSNATYNVSLTASLRTGSTTIELNASTVQLSALGNASVRFVINLTGTNPAIFSGLITVNSSMNNISIPFWLQTQDSVPPAWSGNVTSIPATYSPTTPSIFNVTWTDLVNMHTVLLESNFSGSPENYTMGNITNTTYNFSRVLPAGSHYWKSYANDTSNNKNQTGSWGFSIARATPTLTTMNNTPGNAIYGNVTNVSCAASSTEVTPVLYRNDTNISNSDTVVLAVGTWAFTCNSSQTANYTAATAAPLNITITKAVPTLNLTLNGTAGAVTLNVGASIWLNGSVTTGDGGGLIETFLDGAEIGVGATVANLTNFTSIGQFNITLYYTETGNYTTTTVVYFVTVVDVTAPTVSSHTPTGTVTSSSTTLTATTDENSTCRYSTAAGTAYASMSSAMSGNTATHTASLSDLSSGTYHYYIRCNNTAGLVSTTDYDASFTVSISTGGGGGGGSVGITTTADTAASTTQVIASVSEAKGVDLHISKESIPVNKIEVEVTSSATNVEIQVSATDEKPESVDDPLLVEEVAEPESVVPGEVSVEAGAQKPRRTYKQVYKYLEIEQKNLAGKIKGATIEFKVTTSWLAANSHDKSEVVLLRHTGTSWEELPTELAKETTANVYYRATTPGFSVFAIIVKETEEAQPEAVAEVAPEGQPVEPPAELPEEQPAEPPEQPTVQSPSKAIFQSLAFTIAVATILASAGLGYIYRNRLTIGARIDEMLERLERHRGRRERRK